MKLGDIFVAKMDGRTHPDSPFELTRILCQSIDGKSLRSGREYQFRRPWKFEWWDKRKMKKEIAYFRGE